MLNSGDYTLQGTFILDTRGQMLETAGEAFFAHMMGARLQVEDVERIIFSQYRPYQPPGKPAPGGEALRAAAARLSQRRNLCRTCKGRPMPGRDLSWDTEAGGFVLGPGGGRDRYKLE